MATNDSSGAITVNENENVERKEHWNSPESQKRSLANLRKFGPDNRPAHPGRKRQDEVQRLFRKAGKRKVPNDPRNRSMLQLAVETMFIRACKGDVPAAALVFERLWGKAPRSDELEQMMMDSAERVIRLELYRPRFGYDYSKLSPDLKPGAKPGNSQ